MNKFKLIAAALLASTMGVTLVSCGQNGEITSIAIKEGTSKKLNLNESVTLHVNISINGEATKDVDWVCEDEPIAEITPDGASCKVKGIKEGTVKIIFQVVGGTTIALNAKEEGEYIQDFVGPLGCASELIDTEIYHLWVTKVTKKHLWSRVLVSNAVSIPVDSLIFSMIAFVGTMEMSAVISIFWANVIIKGLVTLISIPAIYIGKDSPEMEK